MKIVHTYGIALMLLVVGVTLWVLQRVLWYIGVFCVLSGGAATLIALFRFWVPGSVQVSQTRHSQKLAWADLDLQKRVIAHGERFAGSIKRDPNGTVEVLIPTSVRAQLPAGQPGPIESVSASLPVGVRYEDIQSEIPRGHGLLGISPRGVETCEFEQFMTMLVSGGSNSGKSNTVGLKLHEAIQNGRDIRLIVVDWHARKPDSLYNKISAYESRFLMPVVVEEEETLPALQWFYDEFKRRRAEYDPQRDNDILLVVDEVPGMMDAEDKKIPEMLKLIARKCGRESRGFGMYGWFIAQQMIGLAWLRNVVHTVIAHKSGRMNEALEASNQHREIARDMENWPQGRVAVYGQNFPGTRVLQMPIFQPRPHEDAFFQPQPWEDDRKTPEDNGEEAGRDTGPIIPQPALELRDLISLAGKMRREEGKSIDSILRDLGLPPGGRLNQNLKSLIETDGEGA